MPFSRIDRNFTVVPVILLVGGAFVAGFPELQPPPGEITTFLAITAILLLIGGIPHGCFDHEVYRTLSTAAGRRPRMRLFYLSYVLIAALYALVWRVSPLLGLGSFYVLTWYHWGDGDLDIEESVRGSPMKGTLNRCLYVVGRGGLPMAVPLLADPETVWSVFDACLGWFPESHLTLTVSDIRMIGLWGSLLALVSFAGFVGRDRSHWKINVGETLFLLGFFLLLNPLYSVTLYFFAWHSLRHLGRLGRFFAGSSEIGRKRLFYSALAILGVTLAGFTLIASQMGNLRDARAGTGLLLVFICCITLPHTVVCLWLRRGFPQQ